MTHGKRRQKPILGDKGLTFQSDGSVVFVRSQPCNLQPTLQRSAAIHADLPMPVLCLHGWHFWTIPGFPPVLTGHILHHAKKEVAHCLRLGRNVGNSFREAQAPFFWLIGEQMDPALPPSRPQQLRQLNAAVHRLAFTRNLTFMF